MGWRKELGEQIRAARISAGLSQEALASKTSVKREQISNIERGKCAPAVNIVTEIAAALGRDFEVGGCRIGRTREEIQSGRGPAEIPHQTSFEFDVQHRFEAASLTVTSVHEESIELRAVFSRIRSA